MFQFKNRKIIVDIITIFISLLLMTVGSIIFYSYHQNKESFLKIGAELVDHDHQQIVEKLKSFLSPKPFIKTTMQFIQDGVLTLDELRSLSSFMHIMLTAYPEFNNVYLSDEEGNVYFESRYHDLLSNDELVRFMPRSSIPDRTHFISQIVRQSGKNQFVVDLLFKDLQGKTISSQNHIPTHFKAKTRSWYMGAKNDPESTWVDFSTVYGTKKETLILSHAVIVDHQFRGVVAADINLNMVNHFLETVASKHQLIFIINQDKKIIASSKNSDAELDFSSLCQTADQEIIHLDGYDKMVHCTDFKLNKGKKWKIISVIPIDYFIFDLKEANKRSLLFSICYLLFGIVLVIIFARKISKPIIQLAQETREISHFHFNKKIDLVTHIYEINVLLEAVQAFRRTAHSFSKYIPKVMVEKLLKYKMIAKAGGQKKELTILFSDVEQFTKIAEQLDPSFLMVHTSEYLERITALVHHYSGNVDKYMGDAVMAFWGAPLENERHFQDACYAVLACRHEVNKLNAEWQRNGKPVFLTRFGLASGTVVVGNVGSSDRLNYTVLGDCVNLTARLQTLNKTYGTTIIVNEAIYQACKDEFVFRVLDRVTVKGKTYSVLIYELIGVIVTADDQFKASDNQLALAMRFNTAFDLFEKQNYSEAQKLFSELNRDYPDDVPTQIQLQRLMDV